MEENASRKFCECGYDYMLKKVGEKELMAMSLQMVIGDVDNKTIDLIIDATYYCLDLY